jgi:hypothetical protein
MYIPTYAGNFYVYTLDVVTCLNYVKLEARAKFIRLKIERHHLCCVVPACC